MQPHLGLLGCHVRAPLLLIDHGIRPSCHLVSEPGDVQDDAHGNQELLDLLVCIANCFSEVSNGFRTCHVSFQPRAHTQTLGEVPGGPRAATAFGHRRTGGLEPEGRCVKRVVACGVPSATCRSEIITLIFNKCN